MEKNVPTKHSRRHSTGNFYLEPTGYEDVLSRYLRGPFPSCHDHCKPSNPPEPKSVAFVTRLNKPHVKNHFTPVPKSPTDHAKITKPPPIEFKAKRQDLKSKSTTKSKTEESDPFYIPTSRLTRRFSDILLPTNDLPAFSGFTRNRSIKRNVNKFESKKVSKPVKSSTVKSQENGNISIKVQNSLSKPEVDHSSKKSKPANQVEVGEEKAQISNSGASFRNEERLLVNGKNGVQIPSKSKRDENPRSESQSNASVASSGVTKTEKVTRIGKLAKENEDRSSQKLKFKRGKHTDKQCESSDPRKLKFGQGKVLDVNQNVQEDGKSLRRLSCDGELHSSESNTENVVLKSCEMEANKRHLQGNNVIEETASKLIKTRKSKVQALVGAFEMISTSRF